MREVLVDDMQPFKCRTTDVAIIVVRYQEQLDVSGLSIVSIHDGTQVGINHSSDIQVGVVGPFEVGRVRFVTAGNGWEL